MAETNPVLFTTKQLAEFLQVSTKTLIRWNKEGIGPALIRVKNFQAYRVSAVMDWLERYEGTGKHHVK